MSREQALEDAAAFFILRRESGEEDAAIVRSLAGAGWSEDAIAALQQTVERHEMAQVEAMAEAIQSGSAHRMFDLMESVMRARFYRGAHAILQWVYQHPWPRDTLTSKLLPHYFGQYCPLIVDSAGYTKIETQVSDRHFAYDYDIAPAAAAVNTLGAIRTPVSANLLHEITRINDIQVTVSEICIEFTDRGTLDFSEVRALATSALRARGAPDYDPSIYATREAWLR